MKQTIRICSLVITSILVLGVFIVEAETPYDSMMLAIQDWYQSNPVSEFTSADSQEIFEWRVALEKYDYQRKVERFQLYERLLLEIGDRQFTHNDWRYNAKSVRAKMLTDYPFWDYSEAIVGPATNFGNIYDWYKNNINNTKEHLYWLRCFMSYVPSVRESDKEILLELYSLYLNEVCQQYVTLVANTDLSSRDLMNLDYFYSDMSIFASTEDQTDSLLSPLSRFVDSISSVLTEETKNALINFVVPDYIDNDYAIKIYAALVD